MVAQRPNCAKNPGASNPFSCSTTSERVQRSERFTRGHTLAPCQTIRMVARSNSCGHAKI
eukprot:10719945-Lingulodinium_polyedra.AAC.1